jgi:hypothetical protein
MSSEKGKKRSLWLPEQLDVKAEETRKMLGLGKSGFYRFCIVETIKGVLAPQDKHRCQTNKEVM